MSWLVVFPISNVRLNFNIYPYTIGNITFHRANRYNVFRSWRVANLPQLKTPITRMYRNKVIIEATNIAGNDVESAINNAIFELEKIFDLFSVVYYQVKQKVVIVEPNLEDDFYVLLKDNVTNQEHFHLKTSDFLKQLTITHNDILKISKFHNIFPFIGKPAGGYSKLESRIGDCLHWCRKANMDSRNEDRLLNYIIGLEHLLLYDKTSPYKMRNLCERTSKILGLSINHRNRIYNVIKKAWELRSIVVHEAYNNLTSDELKLIEKTRYYVYAVAHNLANLSKKRKTLVGALSYNDNNISNLRTTRRQKLNSVGVRINNLPRPSNTRTRYYKGSGTIEKSSGHKVTDLDLILKFYDDTEYVYIEGYGKNFTNHNLSISSNDILYIKCILPSLNKKVTLKKIDFNDDIVFQLPNKIRSNNNIHFSSYKYYIL